MSHDSGGAGVWVVTHTEVALKSDQQIEHPNGGG